MVEDERGTRERSGCALVLGVLLIVFGSLFLAVNLDLLDWSALTVLRRAVVLYADYWPLILVAWGVFKVLRHFTVPSRTRVGFFEVVFLIFVIGCGLTLRTARRVMSEVGAETSFDHVFDFVELEILGAPAHRFTEERSFELGPAVMTLVIENGDGAVDVVGNDSDRIEVVLAKRVHHMSESDAARLAEGVSLDWSDTASGGAAEARLAVRVAGTKDRIGTDLTLRVPRRLAIALSNRRGTVSVRSLSGLVDVLTSNGEVDCRELEGGLRARTSHASIRADTVKGSVDLRNQRGAIDARRIQGDLAAVTSHARITAEDVQGSATLENRYSSVRADRISGNVGVSGEHVEVAVENVSGSVSIRTSHEPVFVRGVEGGATIETSHASIQIVNVTGAVDVSGRNAPVTLSRLGGSARVGSRPSEVSADDVSGPISIEDAGERVRVSNFRSRLEIRSTHAEIVAATTELAGDVSLSTTYGDVELTLPKSASARIVARTRDGDFRSELSRSEFVENAEGGERRWNGTLGAGGHAIEIAARHGDVRLRESP